MRYNRLKSEFNVPVQKYKKLNFFFMSLYMSTGAQQTKIEAKAWFKQIELSLYLNPRL